MSGGSVGSVPLTSGCFWDHIPSQGRTRFNLLLLEHGEVYFGDYAVIRFRIKGRTKIKIPGRLKVSSRSLVFDPVGDVSQPLLRFPYKNIARLLRYTPSASEAAAWDPPLDGLFIFSCATVSEMKANDLVGPYIQKRCGEDYEGPDFVFKLQHTPLPDFLGLVDRLLEISAKLQKTTSTAHAEEALLRPLLEEREHQSSYFDPVHLIDFREKLLLPSSIPVDRISPLIKNPGVIMLTDKRLYFQPADLNNVGISTSSYSLSSIVQIFRRRYMLRQTGLEIFFSEGGTAGGYEMGGKLNSVLFSFRSSQERDRVHDLLMRQPELAGLKQTRVAEVTRQWQARKISNLEYLSYLNTIADRSFNDLTQYPVFPWLIADYTSKKLDLEDPKTFRDLSKPIGALNEERLAYLRERYRTMPDENPDLGIPPRFLYGTHYSTPGYVLFYLVRAAPEYMLCLQDGKFDAADRMFFSIADTWRSCLSNPADLKELIPEFYCSHGEFLKNVDDLRLGTTQGGLRVNDVILPPWAKSERDFVRKLKKALNESDYASEHIHEWIDLIFGYKQRGQAGIDADNLFYHLTYEGAVDLEKVEDPLERAAFEVQIREFGQTPKQVFVGPHPKRSDPLTAPIALAPAFQEGANTPGRSGGGDLGGTWEMIRGDSVSEIGGVGGGSQQGGTPVGPQHEWEILKRDDLSLSQSSVMTSPVPPSPGSSIIPPPSPVVHTGGLREGLSPRALMAKGLGFAQRGLRSPTTPLQTSTSSSNSSSIRLDEKAQRMLEDLINQAHLQQTGEGSLSDSLRHTPNSTRIVDDAAAALPSVVRLEDLATHRELAGLANGSGKNGGGGGGKDGDATLVDPVTIKRSTAGGYGPDSTIRLKGSPAFHIHRDKVSCVVLAEKGRSVCSTSDDGSFRVSTVMEENGGGDGSSKGTSGEEEELLNISLRSKRHFTPSEIALSCCALVENEVNPLAILGSWDNSIYIYSISSARQILKLDAHDDGISSLDVKGSHLCTGSWDATVKIWSLLPTGIDPQPLVEFFDQSKQVQSVSLSDEGNLVAAGAEDGNVVIWDIKSRAVVASFEGSMGGESVTCVRWGKAPLMTGKGEGAGANQHERLYVTSVDGSLRCYSADGRLLSNVQTNIELRSLEVRAWGSNHHHHHAAEALIIGGGDGSLHLWSSCPHHDGSDDGVLMKEILQIPHAHQDAITCLDVDWENARIVTGSQDASIRFWTIEMT